METCPWCGGASGCSWLPCRIAGWIERALGPVACVALAGSLLALAGLLAGNMLGWLP